MELLRIEGSRAELVGLRDVEDLQVVAPSAIDRGDGTWLVSAYAPDGAGEDLRARGYAVERLKGADQLRSELAVAAERRRGHARATSPPARSPSDWRRSRAHTPRVLDGRPAAPHPRGARGPPPAHRPGRRRPGRGDRRRARARMGAARLAAVARRGPRARVRGKRPVRARRVGRRQRRAADPLRALERAGRRRAEAPRRDDAAARPAGEPRRPRLRPRRHRRPALHVAQEPPARAPGAHRIPLPRRGPQPELRHRLGLRALLQRSGGDRGAVEEEPVRPADLHRRRGRLRARDPQRPVADRRAAAHPLHGRPRLRARHPLPLGHGRRPGPRSERELPEPGVGPRRRARRP